MSADCDTLIDSRIDTNLGFPMFFPQRLSRNVRVGARILQRIGCRLTPEDMKMTTKTALVF
jgi:hypothetical protein